jgi:hypothetical protein
VIGNGRRQRVGRVTVTLDPSPTVGELTHKGSLRRFHVDFHLADGQVCPVTADSVDEETLLGKINGLDCWVLRDEHGMVTGSVNLLLCCRTAIYPL